LSENAIIYIAATLVSAAGVVAVVIDRFRKGLAGMVVLAAAVCPWLMVCGLSTHWGWLRAPWTEALGLFGAPVLFVIAFFLFGLGKITPRRGLAAAASLAGMFIGLGNTLLWFHLLSRME
jgi:hypothetical protein